jgi:hypothetical protein
VARFYVTTDKKFIKEFDSQSRELIISPTQLFWKDASLANYKIEGMENYNKLAEVKEDYFYFLVARELARNVYTMKQFLMIDELATQVNELETKTIAYLNSMLEDTELKYSQLELVFSKNIMDCLMSLDPPIHDDYLYFIGLTKNNDRAKEIMIKKLELALGYSFINNNSLEEVELWNEALRVLYE